jgi:hypothetical protein
MQAPHLLALGLSTGDIMGCHGLDLFIRMRSYQVMARALRLQTVTDNTEVTSCSARQT